MPSPTEQQFKQFQNLYNHFNKRLFDNDLPACILLLSTSVKKVAGHFTSQRWEDRAGNTTYEITMNPYFMSEAEDLEICKKLAEVMVLLWQYEYGTPSRKDYYNKEWANKMESIGLIPSHTGKEGGKRTGQNMDSYHHPKELFIKAAKKISEKWLFPFRLTEAQWERLSVSRKKAKKKLKTTYRCSCGDTFWGKSDLKARCKKCNTLFKVVLGKR